MLHKWLDAQVHACATQQLFAFCYWSKKYTVSEYYVLFWLMKLSLCLQDLVGSWCIQFFGVLWSVCPSPWLRRCECRKFWHDASDIYRRPGSRSRSSDDADQLWWNGSLFYGVQVWFRFVFQGLWLFLDTVYTLSPILFCLPPVPPPSCTTEIKWVVHSIRPYCSANLLACQKYWIHER